MDNKSNKDSIKEMLEGHKKKFNLVAVVVGVAVVVIIALGAVYVIHTLNSTPKSYTEKNLNKFMEKTKAQTENANAPTQNANVNTSENGSAKQITQNSSKQTVGAENENVESNQPENSMQNSNQPKTYPVASQTGNATKTSVNSTSNKNTTQVNNVGQSEQTASSTPQIINPYSTKKPSKTKKIAGKAVKTEALKKHKKSFAKKQGTKRHLKHKYVAKKQYALQVSSNLDKKFVSITLKKLKSCGYKTYIRIKIINNKVYRRVMVGPIAGYTAAKDEALLIKRQLKLNYVPIIKKYDKIP